MSYLAFLPWVTSAAIFAFSLTPATSHVHQEPGFADIDWYPKECCSDGDCRPATFVGATAAGIWLGVPGGLTVLVGPRDARLTSKDNRWHICIAPDDTDTPAVRCVFEPAGS